MTAQTYPTFASSVATNTPVVQQKNGVDSIRVLSSEELDAISGGYWHLVAGGMVLFAVGMTAYAIAKSW